METTNAGLNTQHEWKISYMGEWIQWWDKVNPGRRWGGGGGWV